MNYCERYYVKEGSLIVRIILIIIFAVFLSACVENPKSDKQLMDDIAGIWSASYDEDDFWLYGESLYRKDGTSIHIGKICISNKCRVTTVEEKFKIKDGALTSVVLSSDDSDNPVGRIVSDSVADRLLATPVDVASNHRQRVTSGVLCQDY